ncbi:MAG: hypothetical protein OSB14_01260, partial [Planctomycetota bacterium]|nr:hypothetical protein [Planctomycetota bacterium]
MNILLLSLSLLSPAQEPETTPPAAEVVELAVEELKSAFAGSDTDAKLQAITINAEVLHPDVIELIAKGMKDKASE